MESIKSIRKQLKEKLIKKGLKHGLALLTKYVNLESDKYNELNLYRFQYQQASIAHNRGTYTDEDARVVYNKIVFSLFELIDALKLIDLNQPHQSNSIGTFEVAPPTTQETSVKKGKILYKIPNKMSIGTTYKCFVRVAFTEEDLEYLIGKDTSASVNKVRIAELMQIQLIGQMNSDAFQIQPFSRIEQPIDPGDFAEWIIYVEPLLEGIYELMIYIVITTIKNGKEIPKERTLSKNVEIVASPIKEEQEITNLSVEDNSPILATALTVTAGLFEESAQPLVVEAATVPPLTPFPPSDFTWLFMMLLGAAGLFGLTMHDYPIPPLSHLSIGYEENSTRDSIILSVLGNHPPFKMSFHQSIQNNPFGSLTYTQSSSKTVERKYLQDLVTGDSLFISLTDAMKNQRDTTVFIGDYLALNYTESPIKDSVMLEVLGDNFPFELFLKRRNSDTTLFPFDTLNFSQPGFKKIEFKYLQNIVGGDSLYLSLFDEMVNRIDTAIFITDTIPTPEEKDPLTLICNPTTWLLNVQNGKYPPFKFSIYNVKNPAKKREFYRNGSINSLSIPYAKTSFLAGEIFRIDVLDAENHSASCTFKVPIISPSLNVVCNFNDKAKKLEIKVRGNRPPFKLFVQNKAEATLKKSGSHFKSYPKNSNLCGYIDSTTLKIMVKDKEGTMAYHNLLIGKPCHLEEVTTPYTMTNCFDFTQFDNNCGILYLYQSNTASNWKMRTQTFNNCDVVCQIKNENFKFYEMEISSISSNCDNSNFTNLTDITTFIYKKNELIRLDGFIAPQVFVDYLNCPTLPPPPPGERLIEPKPLSFYTQEGVTYKYEGGQYKNQLMIKQAKESYRVRLFALKLEKTFNDDLDKIVEENINYPTFIRRDKDFFYIYFGDEPTKKKADIFKKRLKADKKLKRIFKNILDDVIVEKI